MKKSQRIFALAMAILMSLSLASCTSVKEKNSGTAGEGSAERTSGESGMENASLSAGESGSFSGGVTLPDESDMFPEISAPDSIDGAVSIVFSEKSVVCGSSSVTVDGSMASITGAGTYVVSGTTTDGQIVINAGKKDSVCLVLDGADITKKGHSALYVIQAGDVCISLADGKENSLSSLGEFVQTDENNADGAIFSKETLTFDGSGTLCVSSDTGHGIVSKDDLIFTGGVYAITAAKQAISGKDSVRIKDGSFALSSGKDGIHSENSDDSSLGYIYIENGSFSIDADGDGIDASSSVKITGGKFSITSGDRSAVSKSSGGGGFGGFFGYESSTAADDGVSTKGIKASSALEISGGTFIIDSADDALHSNGNIFVIGGDFTIATGDDGMHADETLEISGGTVVITDSYEGLEGKIVDISGGNITLRADDDGINAAGGNDGSGFGGFMKPDAFGGGSSEYYIRISGGIINVDADGDGVDSNGNLYVSGGETYVNGPTNSANGAIDYEGSAEITGGIFVAAGASGMMMNFGQTSTQGSILTSANGTSKITLSDEDGNVLISFTPSKSCACVVISCPELVVGGKYTISVGSNTTQIELTSLIYGSSGGMSGGRPGGGFGGGGKRP